MRDSMELIATIALGLIGLYLAHGYRRQARLRLAEVRRSAYALLWEETGLAAPTRLEGAGAEGTLSASERQRLYQRLTNWYYRDGNGMLLEQASREIYLTAKHNLTCDSRDLRPDGLLELLPTCLSDDQKRGCLSIRQLSLLRTQMKADLAIFGHPYVRRLADHERLFLKRCGVNLRHRPWRKAARGEEQPDRCGEA
jgi:hypothetical protein